MSASMVGLIYKIPFGGMAAKAIAVKLADNSNDDGENIWPSKANVAEAVECSKRTVDRYVDLWLVLGILRLDELGGGRRKDEDCRGARRRKGRTNVYSFNVPLLHELAAGRMTIADLIRAARERGDCDEEGWPTPEAIARAKGAIDAPFEGAEPDGETVQPLHGLPADETVQPLHGSGDDKGCNPVKERVQPCQEKGATVAPEPSLNHQRTPNRDARAGAREAGGQEKSDQGREPKGERTSQVEELLGQVITDRPQRQRVVDLILAPICRQLPIKAPDRPFALGMLADWLTERKITEADAQRIVERVTTRRRANFSPGDVIQAAKEVLPLPNGQVLITRQEHPEAVRAWLAYLKGRTAPQDQLLAKWLREDGRAVVPSRFPPARTEAAA